MLFQPGDVIGDYRVTGILGRGGMGKVYRVRSLLTEREEAMKVVVDDDPVLADRFLREIKVHASLQHPNIAMLRAARRLDQRVIMIMELVEGVTLEEKLRQGALELPVALRYLSQLLSALGFAHEHGVIHRDIKPANILVAGRDTVKLTDFGIARSMGRQRLTPTGFALGTLSYMPPEQVRGETVDVRSDIYALGLTAYEMFTGRRAITGESVHGLMNAQFSYMPPPPSSFNPELPQRVSDAILQAIAKAPELRFQNVMAFRAAIEGTQRTPSASAPRSALDPAPPLAPGVRPADLTQTRPRNRGLLRPRSNPGAAQQTPGPACHAAYSAAVLERLTGALANYMGPVARILVARAARLIPTADALLDALAAEIPSPVDRRQFLASMRSIL